MLKLKDITQRMNDMGLSARALALQSDVSYTTFNDYYTKKRPLDALTTVNYRKLINSIFTPFEQFIIETYGELSLRAVMKVIEDVEIDYQNIYIHEGYYGKNSINYITVELAKHMEVTLYKITAKEFNKALDALTR